MSLKLGGLVPQVAAAARYSLALANYFGLRTEVTSGYRSLQEQQHLYNRFLRGESRYPANRPGNSAHNYGLAWDSWVPAEQMALWKLIREYVGFRVPDNDLIHAEVQGWRQYVQ